MRAVQPIRTARIPREPAGKMPDLVEVALQIGKYIFAFGFGDAFFARQTRRAERQDARLDRLRSIPAIRLAEFKQAHVALPVIQIPFQRARHADGSGRAQHAMHLRPADSRSHGRCVCPARNSASSASSTSGIEMIS